MDKKTPIEKDVVEVLTTLAIIAQTNTYSPHSNFPVGAALLASNEVGAVQIFIGTNIEIDSYGLTLCAERAAMASAISNGFRKFHHMVVITRDHSTSCGACRQFMLQFSPSMVVSFGDDLVKIHERMVVKDMLPNPFILTEES
jgi:cytidine deaminase